MRVLGPTALTFVFADGASTPVLRFAGKRGVFPAVLKPKSEVFEAVTLLGRASANSITLRECPSAGIDTMAISAKDAHAIWTTRAMTKTVSRMLGVTEN
jgi:hypothetical protein